MLGSLISIPAAFALSLAGWRRDEGRTAAAAGMAISGVTGMLAILSLGAGLALMLCD